MVASDLSPSADWAVARAVQLAAEHGSAVLTVFRVLHDSSRNDEAVQPIEDQTVGGLCQNLRALLRRNREVVIRFTTGKPVVEINHQAREEAIDLAVVGAPQELLLMDALLDSTLERVTGERTPTVVVVKKPTQYPYRRILVTVDFSPESRSALERAYQLAPHAEFHVLHVYDPPSNERLRSRGVSKDSLIYYRRRKAEQVKRRLEAFLSDIGGDRQRVSRVVPHTRVPDVINAAAEHIRADLVTVGTDGLTTLGGVAERVLREVGCDVLMAGPLPSSASRVKPPCT
jgi:nucleotide-binding universal stress UspA family protein